MGDLPGVVCSRVIACICTWSNYIIGRIKLNHREVYGIDDAGTLLFGRVGRGVLSEHSASMSPNPPWAKKFHLLQFLCSLCVSLMMVVGRVNGLAQIVHDQSATGEAGDPPGTDPKSPVADPKSFTIFRSSRSSPWQKHST